MCRQSLRFSPLSGVCALALVLLGVCCGNGCGESEPDLEPTSGSLTGYYEVRADPASVGLAPEDVLEVQVGGVKAIDLAVGEDGWLGFLVQGAPVAGPAQVRLYTATGYESLETQFEYAPPVSPHFDRVVAFGASLTQGVQDGTPTHDGVMRSPVLQVARSMGAYMPQPVLVPDLFPTVSLDMVGPGPECETEDVETFITQAIPEVLQELSYPDGSGLGYELGRSDPLIEVRNVAAGSFQLDDVLYGADGDELVQNVLGGLAFDPLGHFATPTSRTMLEVVEDLDPTVILSVDLLGNDVLRRRSSEHISELLPPIVERLAATGAEVFLADTPNPEILEGSVGGSSPGEEEAILSQEYNAILVEVAADYPNVHVVPLSARADLMVEEGLLVGDEALNHHMLGGLLSFDGLHFSDSGYALAAQLFVDEINASLGTDMPDVDMGQIVAGDMHTPSAVRSAGREPSDCWVEP